MAPFNQLAQIAVGSETGVDGHIIDGIVFVIGIGAENRI
ncbi:hypothetical protein SDC9_206145 [bioreactor metagenome]|uniref:Uncharacterized protein n=1 Tax=bioreactor metagenome TaxID=1076179 RepID=A0A645J5M2_9ZZZZ